MAQSYKVCNLLAREECVETIYTYLVPLLYMKMRRAEIHEWFKRRKEADQRQFNLRTQRDAESVSVILGVPPTKAALDTAQSTSDGLAAMAALEELSVEQSSLVMTNRDQSNRKAQFQAYEKEFHKVMRERYDLAIQYCAESYQNRSTPCRTSKEKEPVDRQCVPMNLHLQIFSIYDVGHGFGRARHHAPENCIDLEKYSEQQRLLWEREQEEEELQQQQQQQAKTEDPATQTDNNYNSTNNDNDNDTSNNSSDDNNNNNNDAGDDTDPSLIPPPSPSTTSEPKAHVLRSGRRHALVPKLEAQIKYHTVTWGAPCSHHDGFSNGGASIIYRQLQDLNSKIGSKSDDVRVTDQALRRAGEVCQNLRAEIQKLQVGLLSF